MGQWLERNAPAIYLAFEVIDRAHDRTTEPAEAMPCDIVEAVFEQQSSALRTLYPILGDLNCYTDWGAQMGQTSRSTIRVVSIAMKW